MHVIVKPGHLDVTACRIVRNFREFREKIYYRENIIVNIRASLTFVEIQITVR